MCCIICQKNGLFRLKNKWNSLFSLALVIVDKWYRNFRAFRSKREKGNTSKGITFFPKTFHRDEPFHLNSHRKFHSNGKRSSLPELRNLLFFSVKTKWQFKSLNHLEFRRKWFLDCRVFARVVRKYPYCLFWFCGFAVTSHGWLTPEYVWIFNACSTRNVEPDGRVYFPLPDLSRKIERDSARREPNTIPIISILSEVKAPPERPGIKRKPWLGRRKKSELYFPKSAVIYTLIQVYRYHFEKSYFSWSFQLAINKRVSVA